MAYHQACLTGGMRRGQAIMFARQQRLNRNQRGASRRPAPLAPPDFMEPGGHSPLSRERSPAHPGNRPSRFLTVSLPGPIKILVTPPIQEPAVFAPFARFGKMYSLLQINRI